jgi:hypothetical protein
LRAYRLFLIPRGKQITVPLHLPLAGPGLTVLTRFRDFVGVDCHRPCWCFASGEDSGDGCFRMGSIDPQAMDQTGRTILSLVGGLEPKVEEGSRFPEGVAKSILPLRNAPYRKRARKGFVSRNGGSWRVHHSRRKSLYSDSAQLSRVTTPKPRTLEQPVRD